MDFAPEGQYVYEISPIFKCRGDPLDRPIKDYHKWSARSHKHIGTINKQRIGRNIQYPTRNNQFSSYDCRAHCIVPLLNVMHVDKSKMIYLIIALKGSGFVNKKFVD